MNNIEKIKKHFENLRDCHYWAIKNPDDEKLVSEVLPYVEKEYKLLESLGVSVGMSAAVFLFGGEWQDYYRKDV